MDFADILGNHLFQKKKKKKVPGDVPQKTIKTS